MKFGWTWRLLHILLKKNHNRNLHRGIKPYRPFLNLIEAVIAGTIYSSLTRYNKLFKQDFLGCFLYNSKHYLIEEMNCVGMDSCHVIYAWGGWIRWVGEWEKRKIIHFLETAFTSTLSATRSTTKDHPKVRNLDLIY